MIPTLIDKQDGFEIVRDQIASILALEVASQMTLADAAGENPNNWKLRIFSERSNPWEMFLNTEHCDDVSPVVNVWYDNTNFNGSASDTIERQKAESTFNIDCYGYGRSADVKGVGHTPGDEQAAQAVHRALRLVRNIIMASEYTYLGLQGTVWKRWPQSITVFQPQGIDQLPVQNVIGSRFSLSVEYNEFSPQAEAETLELLSVRVKRTEDDEIVIRADYDYTT